MIILVAETSLLDSTRLMTNWTSKGAWAAAGASFLLLYWGVISRLVHDWANDDNYSHGFLIVPLALYFAWERRDRVAAAGVKSNLFGLLVVAAGLAMLVVGLLGAELFVTRTSMIVVLAGGLLFVLGWPAARTLAFPVAFLVLMVPIPAIIFNQIAFPLQLLASRVGEATLSTVGVPVLREGNVIVLANTTLEVAEACSGIRSLISLLTLGIVFGYFSDPRPTVRALIALSTVPIAIVANAARVAGTGLAAHYYGPSAAEGFFHTFSGWLVFVVAFLMVFATTRLLLHFAPQALTAGPAPTAAA
jgi:exosortase